MKYRFTEAELKENKQAQNAVALLDLLNEHEHTNITMHFTRAGGGKANLKKAHFTIPRHALAEGEAYTLYYVIHEFTHCLGHYKGHDNTFKRKERTVLNLLGMSIDYARAYPKALYVNGEKVYNKTRRKKLSPLINKRRVK